MKRIVIILTLILAVNIPAEMLTKSHYSELLKKEKEYMIYLPDDAEEGERFPVLYMLHGKWGSHVDWPEKSKVAEQAKRFRMIIVFPDGDQFSWYLDSPLMAESQYQSYVTTELREHVEATYPALTSREARGIMGLSMGGHGAFIMTAKHPELYSAASSLSGVLRIANHPDRKGIVERLGPMEENRELWEDNSAWELAENYRDADVRLLFDCGEDDTKTGVIFDNRELAERLTELKIPHIYREHTGTHSWEYWTEHLGEHLNFHQANFIDADKEAGRWFRLHYERIRGFLDDSAARFEKPEKTTVCLLGSSSAQGFPADLLPDYHVYNCGISGDKLGLKGRGLNKRLESSVFDRKPDYVVIKVGRNDLGDQARSKDGRPRNHELVEVYAEILREIKSRSPKTKIIITLVAPVRGRYELLKEPIVAYNNALANKAGEVGVHAVLDLHRQLMDKDGLLVEEYTNDGLHFKREAYKKWAHLIDAVIKNH